MKKKKHAHQGRFYAALAFLSAAAYYLLGLPFTKRWEEYLPFLQKFVLAFFLIAAILLINNIIERAITEYGTSEGNRYNLIRVVRLITTIFIIIVVASFLFQNFYTVAASLGLISLVLGFALQAPISSFIAWLYIIFRKPYEVGDRIQLKGMRGDVIEIHYLDTTIRECSGDYLGNDHSSGRLIHFPNSNVLNAEIINYSGHLVPFIWNETPLQVAYTSDLQFVEDCLLDAVREDFSERYPHFSGDIDHWQPSVYFRSNTYAWMEAVVSYPVEPTDTTGRRNRILRRAIPALNAQPDRVQFPDGVQR